MMVSFRGAALVAACAGLGVWQLTRDKPAEADLLPPAQAVDHEPHRLTREQALREYQKCLRDTNSGSTGSDGRQRRMAHVRDECEAARRAAYPRARHSANEPLPPPRH